MGRVVVPSVDRRRRLTVYDGFSDGDAFFQLASWHVKSIVIDNLMISVILREPCREYIQALLHVIACQGAPKEKDVRGRFGSLVCLLWKKLFEQTNDLMLVFKSIFDVKLYRVHRPPFYEFQLYKVGNSREGTMTFFRDAFSKLSPEKQAKLIKDFVYFAEHVSDKIMQSDIYTLCRHLLERIERMSGMDAARCRDALDAVMDESPLGASWGNIRPREICRRAEEFFAAVSCSINGYEKTSS